MGEIKYIPFEEESLDIKDRVEEYWTERAESFFAQKQHELESDKAQKWLGEILSKIKESFPGKKPSEIRILDVGCGAGFFTVLLAKEGYNVTGIDLTAEMIEKAGKLIELNGLKPDEAKVLVMDAEKLSFADATFDIIITRNLTWTLPHPIEAYQEWARVLKKGGRAVIFDANWYRYLFDAEAKKAYDDARIQVAKQKLKDFNLGDNFDVMERIALKLPMSKKIRPLWDQDKLLEIGYDSVSIDDDVWEGVWTDEEKLNYTGTPMFRICAVK